MKLGAIVGLSLILGAFAAGSPALAYPKNGVPGQECRMDELQSPGAKRCIDRGANELAKGVDASYIHFVVCLSNGTRACCAKQSDGGYSCGYITDIGLGGATGASGQAGAGGAISPEQSYTPPSATFHLNPGQKQQ